MTREEAIEYNKNLREYMRITDKESECKFLKENYEALEMAIEALEVEPLNDTEQLIFLSAMIREEFITVMNREENTCKEVNADGSVDLVAVCHSVERKVKKALWG